MGVLAGLVYSLLLYDYVDDIIERRAPFREAHLALVREAHDEGVLLIAGALVEPVDGAVFVQAEWVLTYGNG